MKNDTLSIVSTKNYSNNLSIRNFHVSSALMKFDLSVYWMSNS